MTDQTDQTEAKPDNRPGSLFSQPWWLDTVAPGRWDEIQIDKGGLMVARLPYVWEESRFGRQLVMPKLTQSLGPWIDLGEGKLTTQLARHKELSETLIEQLPEFASFGQNFHYSISNWLPWYWAGFQQTTRYTYVLNDLSCQDELWDGLASNIKREIRKARKAVEIEVLDSPDEFFDLNDLVFQRQSKTTPYTREFVERLDHECRRRGRRRIFLARDSGGRPHAAVYLIWNEDSAYYLMGGGDPELRRSGSTSLCMWEAIKFASTVSRRFDFEGSMLEPVERFFRSFGAAPIPFFRITKSNLGAGAKLGMRIESRLRRVIQAIKLRP